LGAQKSEFWGRPRERLQFANAHGKFDVQLQIDRELSFLETVSIKKKLSVGKTKKLRNTCGGIGTPWRRYLSYRDDFYTVL